VRGRAPSLDLGAGLLGALTTAGLLLLSAVIMLATLLLAMRRGADAVATGLTDASITTNLLMALLLGAIVLVFLRHRRLRGRTSCPGWAAGCRA